MPQLARSMHTIEHGLNLIYVVQVHDAAEVDVDRWQSSRLVNSAQVSLVSRRSVHRLTLLPPDPSSTALPLFSAPAHPHLPLARVAHWQPLLPLLPPLAGPQHSRDTFLRDAANGAAAVSDAQRAMSATGIMTAVVFSVCVSTVSGLALDIAVFAEIR